MEPAKKEKTIKIPFTVFESAQTKEELEDWLCSRDPSFIKKLKKSRKDDLAEKGFDWTELKKELCTE